MTCGTSPLWRTAIGRDRAGSKLPPGIAYGDGRLGHRRHRSPARLLGADDLEVLVHENVVRPVDADAVGFVLAVAQLYDAVDDPTGIGGQGSLRRFVRCRSAD